jgi:uncharacterized protein (TIGR02646 family)
MKVERPEAPQFLKDNWQKWGEEFQKNKEENSSFSFQWKQYNKQKVNHLLLPILKDEMHKDHCVYCDGYLRSSETIEHFRPKSRFHLLVYQWENLFYACTICQKNKLEEFDEKLLKPDEEDYSFEKYFLYNFSSGEIEINPSSTIIEQERAKKTIKLLKLNDEGLCKQRKREKKHYDNKDYEQKNFIKNIILIFNYL